MNYLYAIIIIIILHEVGHLFAALLLGIKVEQFVIFLNPFFSLIRFKIKETLICIGWVPFGGYIKIKERNVNKKKLIVFYCAGVFVNLAFGVAILKGTLINLTASYFRNDLHFANFYELTGFLSILIAILNILPLQGTDGHKVKKLLCP